MQNDSPLARVWEFLRKPAVSFTLRIVVSALLLAYLIRLSAFTEIARAFSRINPPMLLACFGLYYLSLTLQGARCKLPLKASDLI